MVEKLKSYPLIEPDVSPAMRYFCTRTTKIAIGKSCKEAPANSTPQSTPVAEPMISLKTTGAVLALVVVKMKANR
jgi:hypothetical protein